MGGFGVEAKGGRLWGKNTGNLWGSYVLNRDGFSRCGTFANRKTGNEFNKIKIKG